ncbi:TPA: hypothetical protein ACJIVJ_004383 [Yersinia enterocolitica]
MLKETFEVVTHAENALAYSNQAIAVLNMWMDTLTANDNDEANRVAAVHSLLHEALSHLQKATEVNYARTAA